MTTRTLRAVDGLRKFNVGVLDQEKDEDEEPVELFSQETRQRRGVVETERKRRRIQDTNPPGIMAW